MDFLTQAWGDAVYALRHPFDPGVDTKRGVASLIIITLVVGVPLLLIGSVLRRGGVRWR
jgi:hypothetical protein